MSRAVEPVKNDPKKCYVCDVVTHCSTSYDEWGEAVGSCVTGQELYFWSYDIIKETPKGFKYYSTEELCEKFVCDNWAKKSAYRTIEEAVYAVLIKRKSYRYHLNRKLTACERDIKFIEKFIDEDRKVKPLNKDMLNALTIRTEL